MVTSYYFIKERIMSGELYQSDYDESQLRVLRLQTFGKVSRSFPDSKGFTRAERLCILGILLPPVQGERTAFDGLKAANIDVELAMRGVRSKLGLHEDASLNEVTDMARKLVFVDR